ncbi:MAG: cell division protein SepF [Methanobrevibacter sp.]|nr:cell division protein SepF [Methanobrevibacter sp.]
MSFMDNLKRSLGYEETEIAKKDNKESALDNLSAMINNLTKTENRPNNSHKQPNNQYSQSKPRPTPNPAPVYEDEYEVIIPEQSLYEIILIRPKTIDDINYVVDQVIEENNPVILDLSFLERESAANFKLAGDKIKQMRSIYGVQALLLARTDDKDLIIVSPKKVRVINKG